MIAAITGATGQLGANLAERLCQEGWTVRATRRGTSRVDHLADLEIQWFEAGLDQPDALARAFDGADAVFHCAGDLALPRHPTPSQIATNVTGTANVLSAARRAAGRLVHTSTATCVGLSTHGELVTEDATFNLEIEGLDDGYAVTKRDAERLAVAAAQAGQDVVIVNPCFLFGPRDARPGSGRVIIELARGKIPALPSGVSNFVDSRDVAQGMLLAWRHGISGQRYLLTGENRPWATMFEHIAAILGIRPPRLRTPDWATMLVGYLGDLGQAVVGRELTVNSVAARWSTTKRYQFDGGKARRELGYTSRDPDEGVRAAVAWFREAGML